MPFHLENYGKLAQGASKQSEMYFSKTLLQNRRVHPENTTSTLGTPICLMFHRNGGRKSVLLAFLQNILTERALAQ
jgi:hypothetical protein